MDRKETLEKILSLLEEQDAFLTGVFDLLVNRRRRKCSSVAKSTGNPCKLSGFYILKDKYYCNKHLKIELQKREKL